MKVTEKTLTDLIPSGTASTGTVPPIFKTINEIVTGVNEMLGTYKQLSGKHNIQEVMKQDAPKESFQAARIAKKAEQGNSTKVIEVQKVMSDDFGDILKSLIKACGTLETMGFGKNTVGEAIAALPFTVSQSKAFLQQILERKEGDK